MYIHLQISVCFVLQYLSEIQHLNLGYNQMECIPVPPAQGGATVFQNMTTLILKNNNLQNLQGLFDKASCKRNARMLSTDPFHVLSFFLIICEQVSRHFPSYDSLMCLSTA